MVASMVVVHLHRQHQGQVHSSPRNDGYHGLANAFRVVCRRYLRDLESWRLAPLSMSERLISEEEGTKVCSLMLCKVDENLVTMRSVSKMTSERSVGTGTNQNIEPYFASVYIYTLLPLLLLPSNNSRYSCPSTKSPSGHSSFASNSAIAAFTSL